MGGARTAESATYHSAPLGAGMASSSLPKRLQRQYVLHIIRAFPAHDASTLDFVSAGLQVACRGGCYVADTRQSIARGHSWSIGPAAPRGGTNIGETFLYMRRIGVNVQARYRRARDRRVTDARAGRRGHNS